MEENELEQPVNEAVEPVELMNQPEEPEEEERTVKTGAIGIDCEVSTSDLSVKNRSLLLSGILFVLIAIMSVGGITTGAPAFFLLLIPIAAVVIYNTKLIRSSNKVEIMEAAVVAEDEQLTIWIPGAGHYKGKVADRLYLTKHEDVVGYLIDEESRAFFVRSNMFLEQLWQDNQLMSGDWKEKMQMRLTVVDPESLQHLSEFMDGCLYQRIYE